jgi:endonuclease-8
VPEGDTIARTAATLDRALAGRRVVRFEAERLRFRPFAEGAHVEGVDAVGKHCLVRFDDGRVLRTHMQMTGSWHLYRPGERWRKKAAAARALVEVAGDGGSDGWVAVCFAAPVVELVEAGGAMGVEHLGPDLCLAEPDVDEAVRRIAELSPPDRPIGEVLLDQRVAGGIGNIHKNEACFGVGIDPNTPLSLVTDTERRALLELAARNLRASLDVAGRPFGGHGPMVYGRRGRPCRRCGATIAWVAQGEQRRGTYWCPACQPARSP